MGLLGKTLSLILGIATKCAEPAEWAAEGVGFYKIIGFTKKPNKKNHSHQGSSQPTNTKPLS